MPYKNPEDKAAHAKRFNAQPHERKRRSERNKARREELRNQIRKLAGSEEQEERKGLLQRAKEKMAGKDVHHRNGKRPPSPTIGGKTVLVERTKNRNPNYGKKKA